MINSNCDFGIGLTKLSDTLDKIDKQPRLEVIKVNKNYLPKFLEHLQVQEFKQIGFIDHLHGYLNLGFNGVPLIIDDSVDTYELIWHKSDLNNV